MADPAHVKILEQGVNAWNKWRIDNPNINPNLVQIELENVNLQEINFVRTNLYGTKIINSKLDNSILSVSELMNASFIKSSLRRANLNFARLNNSNLDRVDFTDTDFSNVELDDSKLRSCNFSFTDFTKASLKRVEISDAIFWDTLFTDCDLTDVDGLDSARYFSGSIIDHRTLIKSTNLPLVFLRGCGLPDEIIDVIPVLKNNPLQFYSCFISYSTEDDEFAIKLYGNLQNKGIRCWYSPENIKGGRKLYDQINEAIRIHDKLLLILSEDSMKSEWVVTEIKKALARGRKEGRQMLFPISIVPYERIKEWELFDSDEGRDLAAEIRSYFIPDFSNWKDYDNYKKSFDRLVKDLRGEQNK